MTGYQLHASIPYRPGRSPTGKWASFTYADTPEKALQRCLEEFPRNEGYFWEEHYVVNLDTKERFDAGIEPDALSLDDPPPLSLE